LTDPADKQRLDKWLWQARFFKTRTLAAAQVSAGHVRIDGEKAGKPAHTVAIGNVLTFTAGDRVRVIQVDAIGKRRGPAPEAQALYTDLTPPEPPKAEKSVSQNPAYEGKGRPTKRDRRTMDLSRARNLE
jgi:ribosome-associated heat shock protein Hsp15